MRAEEIHQLVMPFSEGPTVSVYRYSEYEMWANERQCNEVVLDSHGAVDLVVQTESMKLLEI